MAVSEKEMDAVLITHLLLVHSLCRINNKCPIDTFKLPYPQPQCAVYLTIQYFRHAILIALVHILYRYIKHQRKIFLQEK
jgi:hypothetical protein